MKHTAINQWILILSFFFSFITIWAQEPTVGLQLVKEGAADGYTLVSPNSSRNTYLIDNCGYIVHQWDCEDFPELLSYLLEDGSLLRPSWGSIEKRTWENEQTWRFDLHEYGDNHHDIEPLPNGNVLVIITEYWDEEEAIAKGRNPDLIYSDFGVDAIYEIKPTGPESGEVVWRWRFWDHLIQDYDPELPNYGVLSENPNRLNINYNDLGAPVDWMHCNGIDYNAALDQIVISSRHTSEIYIIDHSTSIEEAQGSKGGTYGRGGDFLWRWGNPKVYDKGSYEDQKLYQQHNPSWVPNGYPDAGKISVFNNNANFDFNNADEYSEIVLVEPVVSTPGVYLTEDNGTFSPTAFDWTWTGDVLDEKFWSRIESGVQAQPNGNFLATLGIDGQLVEVTKQGEVVWVYQNPVSDFLIPQFESPGGYIDVFRAERYAPDFPAFLDKELSPSTTIENENPLSEGCFAVTTTELLKSHDIKLINLGNRSYQIEGSDKSITKIDVYNLMGMHVSTSNEDLIIDLKNLNTGVYFLQLHFIQKPPFTLKLMHK